MYLLLLVSIVLLPRNTSTTGRSSSILAVTQHITTRPCRRRELGRRIAFAAWHWHLWTVRSRGVNEGFARFLKLGGGVYVHVTLETELRWQFLGLLLHGVGDLLSA